MLSLSLSSRPAFALCVLAAAVSGAWAQSEVKPPEGPAQATLPAVKVRSAASEESATSPVAGYRATRQISATKTDTPLAETPQSVTVITRDQLDDRGVTSIGDALRYSSGVVPSAFNYGGDVFTIRGFDVGVAGLYLDGLRAFTNVFSSSIETYGAERIEVVRGPSSVIFGQATPGGVVNVVSKRPQAEAVNEWGFEMGSPSSGQVMADVGGALTKDGNLLGRVVFLGRDGSSEYDFVQDDRLYVAPSLTWKPLAGTTLTLLGSYNEDRNMYVWGNQYRHIGTPGHPIAPVADTYNFAGPGAGYHRVSKNIGYELEQKFDAGLTLRQKLRFTDITTDRREVWDSYFLPMLGLQPDGRTLLVLGVNRPDADQSLGVDTNVEWQGRTGAVSHTLLAGVDLRRNRMSQGIYSDLNVRPMDLYNPVYVEPDWKSFGVKAYESHDEVRSAGLYLQEQAKFGERWVGLAGIRRDRVHQVTTGSTINPATGLLRQLHRRGDLGHHRPRGRGVPRPERPVAIRQLLDVVRAQHGHRRLGCRVQAEPGQAVRDRRALPAGEPAAERARRDLRPAQDQRADVGGSHVAVPGGRGRGAFARRRVRGELRGAARLGAAGQLRLHRHRVAQGRQRGRGHGQHPAPCGVRLDEGPHRRARAGPDHRRRRALRG